MLLFLRNDTGLAATTAYRFQRIPGFDITAPGTRANCTDHAGALAALLILARIATQVRRAAC